MIGDIHCTACGVYELWFFSSNIGQVWIVDYNYNYSIYFALHCYSSVWTFKLQCIGYCYEALYLPSMKLLYVTCIAQLHYVINRHLCSSLERNIHRTSLGIIENVDIAFLLETDVASIQSCFSVFCSVI